MVDSSETDAETRQSLTVKEIDARREAGLKKLLATPPKPHAPLKAKPDKKARATKRK